MQSPFSGPTTLLLLLLAPPALAEVPERIPDPAGHDKPAIWLSSGEAVDAGGEIRADQLEPLAKANLERRLARERKARADAGALEKTGSETCHSYTLVPAHPVVPQLTFESLLDYARLAFVGVVEDRDQGFYHGHPNSLLEIRVEKVLKAPPDLQGVTRLYATFPHVEMKVGSEMVCVRSERYPQEPIPGKRIMIFTDNIPDRDPLIVAPNTEGIFFEGMEDSALLPKRFHETMDSSSWEALVERAIEEAKATPERGDYR